MNPPALSTIGKLAAEADVTTDTVQYYEKEGLLTPASKFRCLPELRRRQSAFWRKVDISDCKATVYYGLVCELQVSGRRCRIGMRAAVAARKTLFPCL